MIIIKIGENVARLSDETVVGHITVDLPRVRAAIAPVLDEVIDD